MILGCNEDVDYKRLKLHVQSEVNRDSVLCIQLFHGGTLVHVEKVPSLDVQWNDRMPELQILIQNLLRTRHVHFINQLKRGAFDHYLDRFLKSNQNSAQEGR